MKRGRNYTEKAALIERSKTYTPDEAIRLAKECSFAKFDETVELHIRTVLDPRHAEQQLRGTALLPHGLGKSMNVVVFAEGEAARVAEEAGATHVGGDELIKRVESGDARSAIHSSQLQRTGRTIGFDSEPTFGRNNNVAYKPIISACLTRA